MGGIMEAVTGGGSKKQYALAQAAQAEQQASLDAERKRLDEVEKGQAKVRQGGGGRGLLAFIDEKLGSKLGGGR